MLEGAGSPYGDDDFSVDDWLNGVPVQALPEPMPEADNSDVDRLRALIAAESGSDPFPEPPVPDADWNGDGDPTNGTPWHPTLRTHGKFLAGIMAVVVITGIVAAVFLFNQTLTPPPTVANTLTSNCDPVDPTPTSVVLGTSGFIYWSCPSAGAFHVVEFGTATPTITKGEEWTTTFIFDGATPTTSCADAGGARAITSGTVVSFSALDVGDWSYCSDFTSAPANMSPITFSWAQP